MPLPKAIHMARKTIQVSKIVDMLNGVLSSDEFLERDKELVSAIVESILETTGNEINFEQISEGFSRKYIVSEEK